MIFCSLEENFILLERMGLRFIRLAAIPFILVFDWRFNYINRCQWATAKMKFCEFQIDWKDHRDRFELSCLHHSLAYKRFGKCTYLTNFYLFIFSVSMQLFCWFPVFKVWGGQHGNVKKYKQCDSNILTTTSEAFIYRESFVCQAFIRFRLLLIVLYVMSCLSTLSYTGASGTVHVNICLYKCSDCCIYIDCQLFFFVLLM